MNPSATQLSDLSSGPLINILSFLPFKESVCTSILSRQWKSLWLSSTNVELFEEYFVHDEDEPAAAAAHRFDFITFVQRWTQNFSSSSIESFRLRLKDPHDFAEDVNQCIALALRKGVKKLEMDFSDPQLWDLVAENYSELNIEFDLLPEVYEHKGLTSLILSWCVVDITKFGDNLSGLKEVCLEYLEIYDSTVPILVEGCPLLESLSLTRCWNVTYALALQGEALNLHTLVIDECFCKFDNNWFGFKAPSLRVFKFFGVTGEFEFQFGNLIEEAHLDFGLNENFEPIGTFLYKLLVSLSSARALCVCSYMLQVIPTTELNAWVEDPFNVRHLTLNTSLQRQDLWGVSFFLYCCPFLETLTVEMNPRNILEGYEPPFKFARHRFQAPSGRLYQCIIRTLKVVEVKGFKGSRGEMSVLKHLIKYGRVLMQVKLYVSQRGNTARYRHHVETLRAAPTASSRLHILSFYSSLEE